MSISGIGSSVSSSLYPEVLARMRGPDGEGSSEEFASSFIQEKDGDGDGLLTLKEAGIDETMFAKADADGDGLLSEEEIRADVESRKQEMQMMGELGMLMQGMGSENLAEMLIAENDEDGDNLLDLEETGLSEELFGTLDTDGDGLVSGAEIEAALQPSDMMSTVAASQEGSESTAAVAAASAAASESASASEDDEEYDEYDLNEDGVVSMDELRQAFINGDMSLESLFARVENEDGGQSSMMRMGMRAYQAQSSGALAGFQRAVA